MCSILKADNYHSRAITCSPVNDMIRTTVVYRMVSSPRNSQYGADRLDMGSYLTLTYLRITSAGSIARTLLSALHHNISEPQSTRIGMICISSLRTARTTTILEDHATPTNHSILPDRQLMFQMVHQFT